ncbi:MAG TPA: hypothetical protein VKU41_09925 [Polyangiaceae bacterium]|nr:hypothetical protein [Polyangiaceae bacterium]
MADDRPPQAPQTAAGPQPPGPTPPPTPAPVTPAPPPATPGQPAQPTKVVPMHFGHGGAAPAPTPTPTAPPGPAPAPAGACLDNGAATVGDCGTVQSPPSSCTAPQPSAQQKCNAYKTYFDPKVAAATVTCLAGLSSAQLCDGTQATACAKAALTQTCADSSVAQLCQIAANSCKATAADCTSILSGLNAQGQTAVAQCVAQGCAGGLMGCVDGLAAASSVKGAR